MGDPFPFTGENTQLIYMGTSLSLEKTYVSRAMVNAYVLDSDGLRDTIKKRYSTI